MRTVWHTTVSSQYADFELNVLNAAASAQHLTMAEYQKTGSLLLAYLLTLS